MVTHKDLLWAIDFTEPCNQEYDEHGNVNDVEKWTGNWVNSTDPEVAARLCEGCHVLDQCLQYALDNQESELIWGGTTPAQRKEILAGRRRAKKVSARPSENPDTEN